MNKIGLIIRREYLTRVKKRSFIIMTILAPLLFAAMYAVPIYLATASFEQKDIVIVDETNLFFSTFKSSETYRFEHLFVDIDSAKAIMIRQNKNALIYIPKTVHLVPEQVVIFSEKQVSIGLKSYVQDHMKKEVEALKLQAKGIDKDILEEIKSKVIVETVRLDDHGGEEGSYPEIRLGLAWAMGFMIYMFIFMFSSQVMRGVIEEKSSRIIEVMVSSVKPFEMMSGKIIGVALVGLTQFLLWIALSGIIIFGIQFSLNLNVSDLAQGGVMSSGEGVDQAVASLSDNSSINYWIASLKSINFTSIIFAFIFYFMGGYLLYASLFAAIGSAVDAEADTQQFMIPISIPLIIALIFLSSLIENPDGSVAFWLSMIPFTSPITMLARIPFGVPWWEIALSVFFLILGVVGAIWVAAKIYRTGILMYGKKINYKELWRWMRYKS